jgi:hypothetical protein
LSSAAYKMPTDDDCDADADTDCVPDGVFVTD